MNNAFFIIFYKYRGMTLIEVIAVMVILSVLMILGSYFFLHIVKGQQLIQGQSSLLVNEQLTRLFLQKQLQMSLPASFRVTNGNRCLKYFAVLGDGIYFSELPDKENKNPPSGASTPIDVLHHTVGTGVPRFVSVGAESSNEVYGNNADSIASIELHTSESIRLVSNRRWLRNAADRRFYVTDSPRALCIIGSELRYYPSISETANNVNLSLDYDVMSLQVSTSGKVFTLLNGNQGCTHCVAVSFILTDGAMERPFSLTVASRYETTTD